MKVIANLGKLNDRHTALIIDNKLYPYYIVAGYNGKTEGNDLWDATAYYTSNIFDFAKQITNYQTMNIGWNRLIEIADKAIQGLFEDDIDSAREYITDVIEMDEDEIAYFDLQEKMSA